MGTPRIRLFGTLSIENDGNPVAQLPAKKVKDLFSYLLLNRDSMHAREQLAGIFWGDVDDRKARHSLNTTLWRLQGSLARVQEHAHSWLRVDPQHLAMNTAGDFWLDVAEFEDRCARARRTAAGSAEQATLYGQAVALYRSDLLVDCYEDWCLIERERLHALYVQALDRLLAYHMRLGEHEVSIEYARRLLTCDPLREDLHRDLIRLYLATRQPTLALRQYRTCESLLREELGAEPMPETRALLTRMADADDTSAMADVSIPSRIASTPVQLTAALGRLHEVLDLSARVSTELQEVTALVATLARGLDQLAAGDTNTMLPDQVFVTRRLQQTARLATDAAFAAGIASGAHHSQQRASAAL